MSAPWYPQPALAWELTVEMLVKRGEAWEAPFMVADLRWWSNQVRIKKAKRIPGSRFFLKRWNCTQHAARSVMSDPETWSDGISQQNPPKESPAARLPPASHPVAARPCEGKPEESEDIHPVAARPPPVDRHTRDGEEQEQKSIEQPLSSQATDEAAAIWGGVMVKWDLYAKARGDKNRSSIKPGKGTATEGGALSSMLKEFKSERLCELLEWMATSSHDRAANYREKNRGAVNMRRHRAELFRLMDSDKTSRTPHSPPTASARGHEYKTPADRWEGVLQQSGYAAGWHEQIEPENRARYRAASGAVGGPNALGGITWPPDVKAMKERFNKAYNNYSERK
jgi:hypothetical protein